MIPVLTFFILFTVSFALYTKWQNVHAKYGYYSVLPQAIKAQNRWHAYGFIMKALVFLYPVAALFVKPTWQDIVLGVSVSAPLWSICINKLALGKDWFYSGVDRDPNHFEWDDLGKFKWVLYGVGIIGAICLKLFTH
jgi:hypothetical protein